MYEMIDQVSTAIAAANAESTTPEFGSAYREAQANMQRWATPGPEQVIPEWQRGASPNAPNPFVGPRATVLPVNPNQPAPTQSYSVVGGVRQPAPVIRAVTPPAVPAPVPTVQTVPPGTPNPFVGPGSSYAGVSPVPNQTYQSYRTIGGVRQPAPMVQPIRQPPTGAVTLRTPIRSALPPSSPKAPINPPAGLGARMSTAIARVPGARVAGNAFNRVMRVQDRAIQILERIPGVKLANRIAGPIVVMQTAADVMEWSRPYVWKALGIRVPGEEGGYTGDGTFAGGTLAVPYYVTIKYVDFRGTPVPGDPEGNEDTYGVNGPIFGLEKNYPNNAFILHGNGEKTSISGGGETWRPSVVIKEVKRVDGLPDPPGIGQPSAPITTTGTGSPTPSADLTNLGNGITGGLSSAARPIGRPTIPTVQNRPNPSSTPSQSDPNRNLNPGPRPNPNPNPNGNPVNNYYNTENNYYNTYNQGQQVDLSVVIAKLDQILAELDKVEKKDQSNASVTTALIVKTVRAQLAANGKSTRVPDAKTVAVAGLWDFTELQNFINQTQSWALEQPGDKSERIYEIMGGDELWGAEPVPQAQVNPDQALRDAPVITPEGLGKVAAFASLPALAIGIGAAVYQRQGLQRFPLTLSQPSLNAEGLLPVGAAEQKFNNATDVTITTSSNGWAAIKGLNEVITKTKLTIQWLRIDRVLNLLTMAATLHNAAMLSRNLVDTLTSTIGNVLAAFGLKDAEGNPFDIGSMVSGGVNSLLVSVLGQQTVTGINAAWNKANRILTAASGVIWAVRSIGDSILSALEIIGSWTGKIGNALELSGVIYQRFWTLVNPSPNFQNRFFTAIERTEEVVSNIDAVAGEALSIQDSITQINENRGRLAKELEEGPSLAQPINHKPTQKEADDGKAASKSPTLDPLDLIRPERV